MDVSDLLLELYGRVPPLVAAAVDGLTAEQLATRASDGANTIGWLLWHLARVEDDHVADLVDVEQVWVDGEWASGFQLEPDPSNTGYGHSPDEVLSVRPAGPAAITGYLAAVRERTEAMLRELGPGDLDRIVDDRWDPPVSMGVRLVSIADDALQHAGQAAYARGMLFG